MEIDFDLNTGEIRLDKEAQSISRFPSPIIFGINNEECQAIHYEDRLKLEEFSSADDDELTMAERGFIPLLQRRVNLQAKILGHFAANQLIEEVEDFLSDLSDQE